MRSSRWRRSLAVLLGAAALLTATAAPSLADPTPTLVVLGDSYSSGEGLYPYDVGTDVPGRNLCHRSAKSYGHVAAAELGYRLVDHSCSGATLDAMDAANPKNRNEPAQNAAVAGLGADDAVALTVGGNDLDWSGLIWDCTRIHAVGRSWKTESDACRARKDGGDALVDSVAARLGTEYRELVSSTRAQVYVLLYPPLIPARAPDATKDCVLQELGPGGRAGVSADTSARMVELERRLNDGIRGQVADIRRTGGDGGRLHVVDTEAAFGGYEGHTISCGFGGRPTPWVNTVRLDVVQMPLERAKRLQEQQKVAQRSMHPTEEGQRQMGAALVQQVRQG
jgi:hypothetical protein